MKLNMNEKGDISNIYHNLTKVGFSKKKTWNNGRNIFVNDDFFCE